MRFLKIILFPIRPKMLFLLKIFILFFNSLHLNVIFSIIFKYFQSAQNVLWIAQNMTWFFNSYRSLHVQLDFVIFYSLKILWILLYFSTDLLQNSTKFFNFLINSLKNIFKFTKRSRISIKCVDFVHTSCVRRFCSIV